MFDWALSWFYLCQHNISWIMESLLALYLDDKSSSYKHTLFSQHFAFWEIFFNSCISKALHSKYFFGLDDKTFDHLDFNVSVSLEFASWTKSRKILLSLFCHISFTCLCNPNQVTSKKYPSVYSHNCLIFYSFIA